MTPKTITDRTMAVQVATRVSLYAVSVSYFFVLVYVCVLC